MIGPLWIAKSGDRHLRIDCRAYADVVAGCAVLVAAGLLPRRWEAIRAWQLADNMAENYGICKSVQKDCASGEEGNVLIENAAFDRFVSLLFYS